MPDKSLNKMPAAVGETADSASTLLPMLIGGLVLIVVGAAVVMAFV
ncbi:MAG: hypothetical protein ACTHJ3_13195 [Pararhizobium sp.]